MYNALRPHEMDLCPGCGCNPGPGLPVKGEKVGETGLGGGGV